MPSYQCILLFEARDMSYPKNIYAFTEPGTVPAYVSLNIWQGGVQLTVRSAVDDGGNQAMIRLSENELQKLVDALSVHCYGAPVETPEHS